mmetsp:Transcript_27392/g.84960  ORF Transcript_27392/g.84960 Transcript_27392/m.84960 type:complete len:254 (+) Transcript_27392:571-1332(+)
MHVRLTRGCGEGPGDVDAGEMASQRGVGVAGFQGARDRADGHAVLGARTGRMCAGGGSGGGGVVAALVVVGVAVVMVLGCRGPSAGRRLGGPCMQEHSRRGAARPSPRDAVGISGGRIHHGLRVGGGAGTRSRPQVRIRDGLGSGRRATVRAGVPTVEFDRSVGIAAVVEVGPRGVRRRRLDQLERSCRVGAEGRRAAARARTSCCSRRMIRFQKAVGVWAAVIERGNCCPFGGVVVPGAHVDSARAGDHRRD